MTLDSIKSKEDLKKYFDENTSKPSDTLSLDANSKITAKYKPKADGGWEIIIETHVDATLAGVSEAVEQFGDYLADKVTEAWDAIWD